MNRRTVKRLMVKGTMTYIAVFSLVLMVAMPAMALIATRNSVDRRAIINGEVTYKDIAKSAVRTSKIAPKAVRYGKIADGAVRGNHIRDGHVKSADIGDGSITSADISSISDSKISYSTKTGNLSIPASALAPEDSSSTFTRTALSVQTTTGSASAYFFAPVYLPNGVVITKLRYYHLDNSTSYTWAALYKKSHTGSDYTMAKTADSVDSPNWKALTDSSISYATINNSSYAYMVHIYLEAADVYAGNIVIDYTYTSPGS